MTRFQKTRHALIPVIAAIVCLSTGCSTTPRGPEIPVLSAFSLTVPALRSTPGQKQWVLLEARMVWFDPAELTGAHWRLSAPTKGRGLHHTVVSAARMMDFLAEADGRTVPSDGANAFGLLHSGRMPMATPTLRTLPPGPAIKASVDARATVEEDGPARVVIEVDASERSNTLSVRRSGACAAMLGPTDILLVDLTRLLGRRNDPKLVLAVAADVFEWKDDVLSRTFPWGIVRETVIKGRRICSVWLRPQGKKQ